MATAVLDEPMSKRAGMTDLAEKVCFVMVHFERYGNSRKVNPEDVKVDADKRRLSVTKRLLESDTLREIGTLDHTIIKWLQTQCLPYEKSLHVLPAGLMEDVDEELGRYERQRQELVDKFVAEYPEKVEEEERKRPLGSLHNSGDYQSEEEVRDEFSMRWTFLMISAPGKMTGVSNKRLRENAAKLEQRAQECLEEWKGLLRLEMKTFVDRLRESLVPGADGKTRKLTDASVDKLQNFLTTFTFRNVTDDEALEKLVGQVQEIAQGVTVEQLRESESLQSDLGGVLAKAARTLETMTQGVRKFRRLDD